MTNRDLSQAPNDWLTIFGYEEDPDREFPKKSLRLSRTDTLTVSVQIINAGGETNMHSHTGEDEAWVVVSGRVRFYGTSKTTDNGEELVGELGPRQGIMIPKGVPYWFEPVGDEQLEILRVSSIDRTIRGERVNYEPLKDWQVDHDLGGREATAAERGLSA